ncbi:hypothetical protein L1285_21180 [Pseudoalteromonas sp. DL2-H2.2]|uniref:hypothetical protein n=1 Tax=Pseudoalteromonas sp. DL2-H2.2 TaxID=2908889 RepID=UPI001F392154|nr:hypothetical protein [Pseudoalteromonas sp. DL2-H2.2]MCF2910824.1 hypothetical protein [Pseudoalteromonas sp. DL2-H2.2]
MKALEKVDWVLVLIVCSLISLFIYAVGYRGLRDYKEPFWIETELVEYSCKSSKSGAHIVNVKGMKDNIILGINSVTCDDLKKFKNISEMSVKVSYGYDDVPYSFEIKGEGFHHNQANGEIIFSSTSYFTKFEIFLIFVLLVALLSRIMGKVRENKACLNKLNNGR